jgi:cytochrome P450
VVTVAGITPLPLPIHRIDPLDPPPELGWFREREPVRPLLYPDGTVGWLVTSHALGRRVLGDVRFSMSGHDRLAVADEAREAAVARLRAEDDPIIASLEAGNFLRMDPPQHTRFRRALAAEFSVHRMRALRNRIDQIVAERTQAMRGVDPPVDLVEEFALAVPSMVIAELLGIPYEERDEFAIGPTTDDPETDGDRYLEAVRSYSGLLVSAGHHTTANMLGLSMYALLSERSRWEQLVAEPDLVPAAVEELLRYLTTFKIGTFTRCATTDVSLGDVVVRAGESVTVSLAAANRDPARFERPDALDWQRPATGHLAFGHGIHVCLGQHLARQELQSGLAGLVHGVPSIRLAVPAGDVMMHPDDAGQAGPRQLPVEWDKE